MTHLIDKDALVAGIKRIRKNAWESFRKGNSTEEQYYLRYGVIQDTLSLINNLEVKEVNLELITDWFDHIAQIADDRMTLTNQRMTDAHALDEIKCLAKNSSEFITKHYKAQKGEKL